VYGLIRSYSQKRHPYFRLSIRQPSLSDEGSIIEGFIATDSGWLNSADFLI